MNATTKKLGDVVMVSNTRGVKSPYVVVDAYTPGADTLAVAPDLVQTIVAKGARGACVLLNVWADGSILNAL